MRLCDSQDNLHMVTGGKRPLPVTVNVDTNIPVNARAPSRNAVDQLAHVIGKIAPTSNPGNDTSN